MAERILSLGTSDDESRIRHAFTLCLSRKPTDRELAALTTFVHQQREHFRAAEKDAKLLAPNHIPAGATTADAAAWTATARVLLNLDEFITRE